MASIRALIPLILAAAPLALAQNATSSAASALGTASPKRGLVYVTPTAESDDDFWESASSDLTWYYNYQTTPTSSLNNTKLQFIPMQWGTPKNPSTDMSFYNDVQTLISGGTQIPYVLGFNEPDGCSNGGSCVSASDAAAVWVKQFEPLKWKYGLQLGAPACTGAPSGMTWLQNWHSACAALKGNGTGCVVDFIPIHWYGNFAGLASHMGEVNSSYSGNISSIWITEFALNDQDLSTTQDFYNQSTEYFDRLSYVGKYSYFGAFRSSVSNVGPNAAFLTSDGKLTDIGSWYLGGTETGNVPSTATTGASIFAGWAVCVVGAIAWSMV